MSSVALVSRLTSLEEFRFLTDEFPVDSPPTKPIALPSLKVLGITPAHRQLSNILQLPALQTAIFYPPPRPIQLSDESLDSFASLIANATKLHFHGWPKPTKALSNNSASRFSTEILRRSPRFTGITFSSGFVECSPLHEHLPSLVEQGIGSGATIEEVRFANCTGMTERDCEQLSEVVGRVKVSI
ncbi:hypothetical protein CPB86DRAFT_165305 [Serendipita vermifera]|nr:hypothetical protein CPB86DRAFT_165305 [Serendipita vermifera]